MATFRITVAYDGTDFIGWQRQAAGTSIQVLIEDALRELDGREVTVTGAGRTDAGVHALGQVASFELIRPFGAATVTRAVNARLPRSVRILTTAEAPPTFHARYGARAKTYRYRIWNGDTVSPFERRYVWQLTGGLDIDAMRRAAGFVEGTHDFAAFQAAGGEAADTTRTITSSTLQLEESGLHSIGQAANGSGPSTIVVYEIVGDGFLRHMVRAIVGSLVEVGRGRRPADWMSEVLASRDRTRAGPTAPAAGLFLVAIDYGGAADGIVDEP